MKSNEGYLRIKLKNAYIELGRVEDKLSNIRVELSRLVDLHAIKTTEIANLQAMIKDLHD